MCVNIVNKLMYIEISLTSNKMSVTFIVFVFFDFTKMTDILLQFHRQHCFQKKFVLMDFKTRNHVFFFFCISTDYS